MEMKKVPAVMKDATNVGDEFLFIMAPELFYSMSFFYYYSLLFCYQHNTASSLRSINEVL